MPGETGEGSPIPLNPKARADVEGALKRAGLEVPLSSKVKTDINEAISKEEGRGGLLDKNEPAFDPEIRALQDRITSMVNLDPQVMGALKSQSKEYTELWYRNFNRVSMQQWGNYIDANPDKAQLYRDYPPIKQVLEGRERLRKYKEQQQTRVVNEVQDEKENNSGVTTRDRTLVGSIDLKPIATDATTSDIYEIYIGREDYILKRLRPESRYYREIPGQNIQEKTRFLEELQHVIVDIYGNQVVAGRYSIEKDEQAGERIIFIQDKVKGKSFYGLVDDAGVVRVKVVGEKPYLLVDMDRNDPMYPKVAEQIRNQRQIEASLKAGIYSQTGRVKDFFERYPQWRTKLETTAFGNTLIDKNGNLRIVDW